MSILGTNNMSELYTYIGIPVEFNRRRFNTIARRHRCGWSTQEGYGNGNSGRRKYVRGDRQAGHTAATSISYGDEQVIRGQASDGNRISYSNSSASERGAGAARMTQ